jgi:membrane protease YdiL (CAAX protease family)
VGFVLYHRAVCGAFARKWAMPKYYQVLCRRFGGKWVPRRWSGPGVGKWGEHALGQLVVVALPEEYFFRGYIQTLLQRAWPARRQLLGGELGVGLVATSALFAVGHVPRDLNLLRLATFFPALAFGWLRNATGSILASVLFHAACNLVSDALHRAYF